MLDTLAIMFEQNQRTALELRLLTFWKKRFTLVLTKLMRFLCLDIMQQETIAMQH